MWRDNRERHARTSFEVGEFGPQTTVIAQMITMIAQENHDRVLPQVEFVHRGQKESHLRVDERDARVISRNGLPRWFGQTRAEKISLQRERRNSAHGRFAEGGNRALRKTIEV